MKNGNPMVKSMRIVPGAVPGTIVIEVELDGGKPLSLAAALPLEIRMPAAPVAAPAVVPPQASEPSASTPVPKPEPLAKRPTVVFPREDRAPEQSTIIKRRFRSDELDEYLLEDLQGARVLDRHGRETDLGLVLRRTLVRGLGADASVREIRSLSGDAFDSLTDRQVLRYFECLHRVERREA